jgi:hypothetical protein
MRDDDDEGGIAMMDEDADGSLIILTYFQLFFSSVLTY